MLAEGRPGDDQEPSRGEAGDGEIALDAAAFVQHRGVHDAAHRLVHIVGAHVLQKSRCPRTSNLDLAKRSLIKQPGALSGPEMLYADRRRPVMTLPSGRLVAVFRLLLIRDVPIRPLPTHLLTKGCPQLAQTVVRRGEPQVAGRLALFARVVDVVVFGISLDRPDDAVGPAGVVRPEAAHIQTPDVPLRDSVDNPLGHDLTDSSGSGQAVGAEGGCHPEAFDLGRAEEELAVRREGLRSVVQLADFSRLDRRYALNGAFHQRSEAVPIERQEMVHEILGNPVQGPGCRIALVAADDKSPGLLPEVHQQIRIAQRRQLGGDLLDGFGDHVNVRHRNHREVETNHPPDLPGPHPAGVDHDLGADLAFAGRDRLDPAILQPDPGHKHIFEEAYAAGLGARRQRPGQHRRVDHAVIWRVDGADDAVEGHQREQFVRLLRPDEFERHPERTRKGHLALELFQTGRRRRQPHASNRPPTGVLAGLLQKPGIEYGAVLHHPRQVDVGSELAD